MLFSKTLTLSLLAVPFLFLEHVNGHGYAYSPRTRNWFAVEEGVEGQAVAGLPNKEYCPDVSFTKTQLTRKINYPSILLLIYSILF